MLIVWTAVCVNVSPATGQPLDRSWRFDVRVWFPGNSLESKGISSKGRRRCILTKRPINLQEMNESKCTKEESPEEWECIIPIKIPKDYFLIRKYISSR